ncbi:phosphohistidine phosphatase SixA [Halomonas sp. Bachu 37]|uniref:phosphohistidine phosphatase SixA n=1 Tax=Halomonas kashgarensis TaxID=3084920 RepID=UPI0032174D3B
MARMGIMRHGEAAAGAPDSRRELTEQGRREVRKMARWLAQRDDIGAIRLVASPFVRAQQTAGIIGKILAVPVETLTCLTPDDTVQSVSDWLLEWFDDGAYLLLVSHMPLVGDLTAMLVEGSRERGLAFPTAALAELEAPIWAPGCATMKRFTQPGQL